MKRIGTKQDLTASNPLNLLPVFFKLYGSFFSCVVENKDNPNDNLMQFGNLRSTLITCFLVHFIDIMYSTLEQPKTYKKMFNKPQVNLNFIKIVAPFLSN